MTRRNWKAWFSLEENLKASICPTENTGYENECKSEYGHCAKIIYLGNKLQKLSWKKVIFPYELYHHQNKNMRSERIRKARRLEREGEVVSPPLPSLFRSRLDSSFLHLASVRATICVFLDKIIDWFSDDMILERNIGRHLWLNELDIKMAFMLYLNWIYKIRGDQRNRNLESPQVNRENLFPTHSIHCD